MTRNAKNIKEGSKEIQETIETTIVPEEVVDLSSPIVEHASSKKMKGKEHMTESQQFEERLKLANQEIAMMRKRARKNIIEKIEFKRMKAVWEGQTSSRFEIPSGSKQLFTLTVLVIKEAKFVRVINTHLRASNRRHGDQVVNLEQ